ncbi:MAG: GHKL domain-containing protein [Eubacteriales bacterium]
MPYVSKGYFDTIDEALQQGYEFIERIEESRNDSSLPKAIEGDYRAWKTSFLSYLKKHFSTQCSEYIEIFEQTDVCDISSVKLYINVLRQIRNGILEKIIFPDSYLKEKDKEDKESQEMEFLERHAYRLNMKISHKLPTITVCFILSIFTCIITMFLVDILIWNRPGYEWLGLNNIIFSVLCAVTIGVLCYLIIFSQFTTSLDRIESRLKNKEKKRQASIKIDGAETVNISSSVQDRLFEEMPGQIAEAVISEIKKTQGFQDRSINFLENDTSIKTSVKSDEGRKFFRTQMRELFHSLTTPISTVNRSLKSINASKNDEGFSEVLEDNLESIQSSVIYINALLNAYRSIAMQNKNSTDSKVNLKQFISDTIKALSIQVDKKIYSKIDKKFGEVEGFESQFIVALLLPLLQNAVEASLANNDVEIAMTESEDKTFIEIKNNSSQTIKSEDLQKDGFTTKGGSHEGLGLSTVRHIADERNVSFEIRAEGNMVKAKLGFPKRI